MNAVREYNYKIFLFFLLGFFSCISAQTISIDQNRTVQELVENVLIGSDCANVSNIRSVTGSTYNSSYPNGIAYFNSNGSNFDFSEGVLISSGDVSLVGQPNGSGILGIADVGFVFWEGDDNLDNEINSVLNPGESPINSINATVIEFDFVPNAQEFSFEFIMASEEYDDTSDFECVFSDAFAFILTDSFGNRSNLAIIPNTNQPIKVTNVHRNDDGGCPPINEAFFDRYIPVGSGPFAYNGLTRTFTASAPVNPGETYRIKLVVADDGRNSQDATYDTGVFLRAGSFRGLGSSLPDFTVGTGNPICGDEPVVLDTMITDPNATFQWYKEDEANLTNPPLLIPGATMASYSVPSTGQYGGSGNYIVIINYGGLNCDSEDVARVEFVNQPFIDMPPNNIIVCDPDGNDTEVFNLRLNDVVVIGGQTDVQVEYFDSNGNRISNPSSYTNTSTPETITVRLTNDSTTNGIDTCPIEDTFTIGVFNAPTASSHTFIQCDDDVDGDDTNGIVDFDLTTVNDQVLGTQDPTQFSVSYHPTLNDAEFGTSPLPNVFSNATQNTVYARVQNNNNIDCYETSTITLQVNALPVIMDTVELLQCDFDTDGITDFNLTEANSLISSNSANETFTYYLSEIDAETSNNEITNPTAYPNTDPSSNPDILFVRIENTDGCHRVAQLELFVSTTELPPGFSIGPFEECDDTEPDDNITDGITVFDFSQATGLIVGQFPAGQDITVTYYETQDDAEGEINQIDPSNHINTISPFSQTIYFRVDSVINNECRAFGEFQIETINPTPNTNIAPIVLCDDVTVGDVSESFDLTLRENDILGGDPNLSATYYLSNATALAGGVPDIPDPTMHINTTPTETIYVRVTDSNTNCFAVVTFSVTVNPLPDMVSVPLEQCENGTDGFFDFDLGPKRDEILDGRDATVFEVTFHLTQQDADDLLNPQPDAFTNTQINSQTIYVAVTNTTTGCSNSTQSFQVEVLEGAQVNSDGEPLDYELCDDNILNDGVAQFDLLSLTDEILDGQNPDDYTIDFYLTEPEAIAGMGQILPTLYENVSNPQTIYVRVSNNLNPDTCFEVEAIPLSVNPVPVFDLEDQYVLCLSSNDESVVPIPPVIDTGLSPADYDFEWSLDGTLLTTETEPSLIPTQSGTYTVEVFDTTTSQITRCSTVAFTEVIESNIPALTVNVTSQAFAGNHTIEAIATGTSTYEFSLDNGPWQTEGVFEDVSPGIKTIYARDVNGCGIVSDRVLVMDYPLYFTPNGDGNHDTWNIIGIDTQPSAEIYIFDRYGKLLKQLSPTSPGWDGTFNGERMPADDYWFLLEYIEPLTGETKQQRAHFTLKR